MTGQSSKSYRLLSRCLHGCVEEVQSVLDRLTKNRQKCNDIIKSSLVKVLNELVKVETYIQTHPTQNDPTNDDPILEVINQASKIDCNNYKVFIHEVQNVIHCFQIMQGEDNGLYLSCTNNTSPYHLEDFVKYLERAFRSTEEVVMEEEGRPDAVGMPFFVDEDTIQTFVRHHLTHHFLTEQSRIIQELPAGYQTLIYTVGYHQNSPVQIISPYDIPPGSLRRGWMEEFQKWKRIKGNDAFNMPFLLFHFDAASPSLGDSVKLLPCHVFQGLLPAPASPNPTKGSLELKYKATFECRKHKCPFEVILDPNRIRVTMNVDCGVVSQSSSSTAGNGTSQQHAEVASSLLALSQFTTRNSNSLQGQLNTNAIRNNVTVPKHESFIHNTNAEHRTAEMNPKESVTAGTDNFPDSKGTNFPMPISQSDVQNNQIDNQIDEMNHLVSDSKLHSFGMQYPWRNHLEPMQTSDPGRRKSKKTFKCVKHLPPQHNHIAGIASLNPPPGWLWDNLQKFWIPNPYPFQWDTSRHMWIQPSIIPNSFTGRANFVTDSKQNIEGDAAKENIAMSMCLHPESIVQSVSVESKDGTAALNYPINRDVVNQKNGKNMDLGDAETYNKNSQEQYNNDAPQNTDTQCLTKVYALGDVSHVLNSVKKDRRSTDDHPISRPRHAGGDGTNSHPSGDCPTGYCGDELHETWIPQKGKSLLHSTVEELHHTKLLNRSKKAKKMRDPTLPKRPSSSYNLFVRDQRQSIKAQIFDGNNDDVQVDGRHALLKENGKMDTEEIAKIIGHRWKLLDPAHRVHYEDLAAAEKERYVSEMMLYKENKGGGLMSST